MLLERPDVFEDGLKCLHGFTERNTTFPSRKAIALQVFAAAVTKGYGIMEACDLVGTTMNVSAQVVRRWASDVFVDCFAYQSTLENIVDEQLEMELGEGILNGFCSFTMRTSGRLLESSFWRMGMPKASPTSHYRTLLIGWKLNGL